MHYLKDIPQFAHLNPKQQKFLLHYYTDAYKVGKDAAIMAGYSAKSAGCQAVHLLKDNRIRFIMKIISDRMVSDHVSLRSRIILELAAIAFSRLSDFISWSDKRLKLGNSDHLSLENQIVVAEVSETFGQHGSSKKIKMHDKIAALKELNRMHGFYPAEEYKITDDSEVKQTTIIILPSNGREKK